MDPQLEAGQRSAGDCNPLQANTLQSEWSGTNFGSWDESTNPLFVGIAPRLVLGNQYYGLCLKRSLRATDRLPLVFRQSNTATLAARGVSPTRTCTPILSTIRNRTQRRKSHEKSYKTPKPVNHSPSLIS